ncbi:DUF559 domain-containing protein [Streptomyces sp. RLA2-12]|nr:DUF559 domain-containing protein [Streptomyces sp. RLA2-12]
MFPDVAVELDLEAPATAGLAADQIVAGSHRRVGWRCSTCGHRWEATVGPRTDRRRAGCPACAGHVVTAATNLAVLRPDLATQWHPTRNGALRPEDVRPGSSASVWWQCPAHEDHQWPAIVSARSRPTNPTGCPACSGYQVSATNNLAALFPSVARQLDPALNQGLTADQVLAGTHDVVTWRCPAGPDHIWSQPVVARTAQGNGCPYCSGRRASVTNHLASRPELVAEFDHEANAPDTPETLAQSSRKRVWWKCSNGPDHRWRAAVTSRAKSGHGCPFCAGHRVSVTNSLHTLSPQAAAQLDPALNDGLTAEQVTWSSPRPVTWKCDDGHTWNMPVRARTRALATGNGGCPFCYPYGMSQRQLAVASALAHALPGLTVDSRPPAILAAGRPRYVDVTVPELRLALEYDGSYYHRGREQHDAAKSAALRAVGWQVVRLREAPLGRIDPGDLPVRIVPPVIADTLVPDIITHLMKTLDPDSRANLETELCQPRPGNTPPWQWTAPPPRFQEGLAALEVFVAREGHALPLSEHMEGSFPLGRWVMEQRSLYRAGKLPDLHQRLLSAQPRWAWDWRASRWGMFLTALNAFAAREGHARVPHDRIEDGYPLGVKVASTRGKYRRGRLPDERVSTLEEIPGWTWFPKS